MIHTLWVLPDLLRQLSLRVPYIILPADLSAGMARPVVTHPHVTHVHSRHESSRGYK